MDDYAKVSYGMRDTLQLIRKGDDDSLFCIAAAGVLSKLAWSVPVVQPNDVRRVLPRIMSFLYRFVCVNVKRSLYLKQHLLYGD